MVKKKGLVWNFFQIKGKGVVCKYCTQEYKQANSVKMERHIKKCLKCPAGLKHVLFASPKQTLPKSASQDIGEPLKVNVELNTETDLTSAGPSSASSFLLAPLQLQPPRSTIPPKTSWTSPSAASSSLGSGTMPIYSPRSSRGIT